jgi:spore germination protein GerM
MNQEQRSNRISSGLIAIVSAGIVAVGGGVAWLVSNSHHVTPPSQQQLNTQSSKIGIEETAQIYWLQDTGQSFKLVPQPIKITAKSNKPNQFLATALEQLLEGPQDGKTAFTAIPPGTKLLSVKVDKDTIRVNLSREFTKGGGSTSMMGRVGQIVYTATSLNPNAKVYIDVDGKRLDVLGGEGLEIEQPLTRESFNQNYQL